MISSSFSYLKTLFSKGPSRLQALQNLLHKNTLLYPCYGPGFSNHISMALVSLYFMDSSSLHMQKYFDSKVGDMEYRVQPDYKEKQSKITEENVTDFINYSGKDHYDQFFSFFWDLKEKKGMEYTINFAFEKLGQNCGAQLLHAIIRIQFGLVIDNEEEIIAGLCFIPVKAVHMFETKHKEQVTFDQAVKNFQQIKPQIEDLKIGFNFPKIFANELFQNTYKDIRYTSEDIPKITETLIRAFIKTQFIKQEKIGINFIVLHMVTSFYALKTILNKTGHFLSQKSKENLIQGLFKQMFAVYWFQNCPSLSANVSQNDILANPNDPDLKFLESDYKNYPGMMEWDEILKRASRSIEDHTIKFVYVCRQEALENPQFEKLYQYAATKRVIAEP